MNEFFAIAVEGHLEELEKIQKLLRRVDSYPLDMVDLSRFGDAQRRLTREIESFRSMAEASRELVPA